MQPENRRQQILDRLRALQQEWKINDLARALGVSTLTIRRDLEVLAAAGTIIRTVGGCMAMARVNNPDYQQRVANNFEKKAAIGRAAAREIKAGEVVIINDGSTTFHLANCLGQCGKITVYTNSIAMISEFSRFPDVKLCILGGEYHPDMFFLGGSIMERVLETIDADIVFVGADAVDSSGRCLAVDHDTARTAQVMLRRARRKILLADDTKINVQSRVAYASLRDMDLWITTPGIPRPLLQKFRRYTIIREVKT
jgi:DeoR/GlpR family transcriptional regulator of sugar metabolism